MLNSVVIKGSSAGMTVILNPDLPFDVLLEDVAKKFRESAKFWGSVQMTLTLLGRELTPYEELQVVSAITENSQIEILCLLDTDANRIARCEKALTSRLMELSSRTGQFYRGNLTAGSVLESEASIVVIGDVEAGARVSARGNVIVLGALHGIAHAGVPDNDRAVICALSMAPTQLKIAGFSTKEEAKGKKLGHGAMVASADNNTISAVPVKKSFLNYFNFI